MLRLYGYFESINVRKILWLCAELNIKIELVERGTPNYPASDPTFLEQNPFGLVPLLEDGNFKLAESNTILRYLVRKEGRMDLLPNEAKSAALVERWIDWQATDFNNSWRYAFVSQFRKLPQYDDAELILRSQNAFAQKMKILDDQLGSTSAYIAGGQFTLADIPIGLSVRRWNAMDFDKPHFQDVMNYYERLLERREFLSFGGADSPP